MAHSGRFILRRQRSWRNQTHGGKYKCDSWGKLQHLNTHTVVYECSDVPMVCRCVGGRRGPQRKAHGWRKPKMLWSLCQRRWRSPSYPDPHHDLLRSSTRRHSPNGTPRSRWDSSVINHKSLVFTLPISADSKCFKASISIWIWISHCCSSHAFFIGIFILCLSLNQLDLTPSQGRFDALLALLRRQYDRVAVMRPTSQDKVRNICSISLQLSVRRTKTLPPINSDYFDHLFLVCLQSQRSFWHFLFVAS